MFLDFQGNMHTLCPSLVSTVQACPDLSVGIAPQTCEAGSFAALGKWGILGLRSPRPGALLMA